MGFMKPQVYEGDYFEVDTSIGTEIVPCDMLGSSEPCFPRESLESFLEGEPDEPDEPVESKHGWLARLSAPGYLDCTDWTAHSTEEKARAYLASLDED